MKFLFSILLLFVVFTSCQKEYTAAFADGRTDTTGTGTGTVTTGSFKAKINGIQFTADKGATAGFTVAANGLPALLNISGLSKDNQVITITLADSGVHKYTLSNDAFNAAAYVPNTSGNTNSYSSNQGPGLAGTVEVTKIDTAKKTISGVFSFKVYRVADTTEKDITEGSFTDVPYLAPGQVLPPSNSTDTFTVKINDTLFKPYSISAYAISLTNSIAITGSDSLILRNIGITCPINVVPGTYTFDFVNYAGVYNTGTIPLAADTGTLQILEHNTSTKRIRGKFNFSAIYFLDPTVKSAITEGYFSVTYQ